MSRRREHEVVTYARRRSPRVPTLARMHIPPPKDWSEFQDIAATALRLRWRSSNLQQYGRNGQRQTGVDISGSDDLGRLVGVQCKVCDELTPNVVASELAKSRRFRPALSAYYLAVTGRRDAKIQTYVRILSEQRFGKGKCPVGILFWDDLIDSLASSPSDFGKHYPQIHLPNHAAAPDRSSLLCALDVAYHGFNVRQTMDLLFGLAGSITGENHHEFDFHMRMVEASARPLMDEEEHRELSDLCRRIATACHAAKWSTGDRLAKQIDGVIHGLQYRFKGRMLAAFDTGRVLSNWFTHQRSNGPITDLGALLARRCKALTEDATLAKELQRLARAYNASDSVGVVTIPDAAYNSVRRRLLNEALK
jgi:hypothetical protein